VKSKLSAFICDSDVFIYDNITNIDNEYLKSYDYKLCSSHSIWNFKNLQVFVNFCFKFYAQQLSNIEKWHKSYKANS